MSERQMGKQTLVCTQCQKTFTPKGTNHNNPPRFCSRSCCGIAHRRVEKIPCKKCGRAFRPIKQAGVFCSKKCSGGRKPQDVVSRFWTKVDKSGECWHWLGHLDKSGYGQIRMNGKGIGAHRFSWQFTYGVIPTDLHVLHRCDNPRCVRPDHLFLGTNLDNVQDKVNKGRVARLYGEDAPSAKLTANQVEEIRARYIPWVVTYSQLAREYNVSTSSIGGIIKKRTWLQRPATTSAQRQTAVAQLKQRAGGV